MRVLILGGAGMLGHRLAADLQTDCEVWVTLRGSTHPSAPEGLFHPERTIGGMARRIAEQWQERAREDQSRREMVATLSHDLRTPLTSLHGYLETLVLKDATLAPAERRRYLEVALGQSRKVGRLAQDLFELAKLEHGAITPTLEDVDLADLLQDVFQKFELAAEWDSRPIVAVTGTNGKTTVTTLITSILSASGRVVLDAGNNDLPLVDALDRAPGAVLAYGASTLVGPDDRPFPFDAARRRYTGPDGMVYHYDAALERPLAGGTTARAGPRPGGRRPGVARLRRQQAHAWRRGRLPGGPAPEAGDDLARRRARPRSRIECRRGHRRHSGPVAAAGRDGQ